MSAQRGQIISIFRERLYLIGFFVVMILLIIAQAATMGVGELEREIIRHERAYNQVLNIRLALRDISQRMPATSNDKDKLASRGRLADLYGILSSLPELRMDQPLNLVSEANVLYEQVLEEMDAWLTSENGGAFSSTALSALEQILKEMGILYRERSDLLRGNHERYQLLSRLYWGGFTLITLVMLFWNIVQRRKLEDDLANQHWLLEEAVNKRTEDLQQLVKGLEERLRKFLEED